MFVFEKRQPLPKSWWNFVWLGIAATSWRLSVWKISRSYWKRQRWKGSESRPQIWFERWKRQRNQRPVFFRLRHGTRHVSTTVSNCIHRMLHVFVYYCCILDRYRALQIIYSYSIPQFMVEWHGINKHYNSTVDELTFADVVSTCVMSFWDAENRGSCNWKIWSQGFILPSRPQKLQQIVGPNFPSFNFVCIFFVVAVWCTLPGFKYVISEGGVESIGKQTIQLFHTHAPDCAGTSLRISLGNMEQLGLSCNIQTWWGAISCVRHVVFPLKVLILDQAPRTKLYLNARAFPSVQRSGVQRLRSVAILAGSGGQQSH